MTDVKLQQIIDETRARKHQYSRRGGGYADAFVIGYQQALAEIREYVEKLITKKDVTMFNFRKKPVVIQAARLTERRVIKTLEGEMVGEPGDWLIRGVKNEEYPCKDDIFRATYEPADHAAADVFEA